MKKRLKMKPLLVLRLTWLRQDDFSHLLLEFLRIYALIGYNLSVQYLYINSQIAHPQEPVSIPPVTH